jgi:sec-independent protein translocase protein TatB
MHVGDTIFIFCLALIIFGPKKLPEIGRQIGKLMVEFRRASNEFKMQIEEELRASDEAERQKEITAATTMLPAAAPALEATVSVSEGNAATGPVIAPPTTGVPVNRSFDPANSTAGTCAYEALPPAITEVDAYPEQEHGFNPGLNTASNGEIAEVPAAESAPFMPSLPHPEAPVEDLSGTGVEKTEAAVHHG